MSASMDPTLETSSSEGSPSLHTMASMRSLIINPSTPHSTISSIFESLTRSLQVSRHKLILHHTLKLLSDLAFHHSSLSHLVFDSIRIHSLLSAQSTRLAVESLEALASISERFPALDCKIDELDDGFFVSLSFGTSGSARLWLLNNAERFRIRPSLLFTVFLGFTRDPYPYVRRAALDGLVDLSKHGVFGDHSLVEGCYRRAVQLLRDMEDCVRLSAVRVLASWGLMLAASNANMKAYWSNEVFAKLCSMARDMSMKVRVEAFNAIGMMEMVSEDFLMQSLSKKVLRIGKQRESVGQSPSEQFEMLASSVAGAVVHGLEDEFFEVRKSVCQSLFTLTILSDEFSHEALNLLVDLLNDDSAVVRLQALATMHHMAINGCLKIQDSHLHMFLGVLVDNSGEVRFAARKILKVVKLNSLLLFKSSVDGLLENLDIYPQDEADVFSTFSHVGRNHEKFVAFIIKEVFGKVEAAFEGNVEFKTSKVAALLILSISAPLSHANFSSIPPIMFSYAVTLLGRICCAFSDVMDRDALLTFLSEKSRSNGYSALNINMEEGEQQSPLVGDDAPDHVCNKMIGSVETISQKKDVESKIQYHIMRDPQHYANGHAYQQQPVYNEVTKFINHVLAKAALDIWPMVKSGSTNEVLRILRLWKEELVTMAIDSSGSGDALAFTLQYLRIIKLIAEVWEHFLPAKWLCSRRLGELDFKLGKLDKRVKELRSRFMGYSSEEELNVLELMLVTCVLRLCKAELCCDSLNFKRLTALFSRVEFLIKGSSVVPSTFVVELRKLICESGTSINGASCSPFQFDRCLKLFSLKQFVFRGKTRHLEAELSVPGNDPEHPLPFVSGLPVGVPCEITCHNISSENRLWLSMSMDSGSPQYLFLDSNLFKGPGDVRNFAFVAPFYRTPKANFVRLWVSIGLECLFEDVGPLQMLGGPKHELALLCPEKEVYLSNVSNN